MSPPFGAGSEVAGRYRVIHHLGSGGMGHVYEALDLERGETVALKVLPSDKRRDTLARSRLVLEGRAAANVRHPGIVRVYDVGEDGEITYVAMELLAGEDLHDRMHRRGQLSIDSVLWLARSLLEAMGAMHAAAIIHRDLKPRNLFLARDASGRETLKVLDFGIAKSLAPTAKGLTDTGQVFGTLHYMAPEQLRGVKHADVRSEIWAAGAILYEALTGRPPFEAENGPELVLKIAIDTPDPVSSYRDDVPEPLRRAIARALQREPAARYPSAREMLAAVFDSDDDTQRLNGADTRPVDASELVLLDRVSEPGTLTLPPGAPPPPTAEAAATVIARRRPLRRVLQLALVCGALALLPFGMARRSEAVHTPELPARAARAPAPTDLGVEPATGAQGAFEGLSRAPGLPQSEQPAPAADTAAGDDREHCETPSHANPTERRSPRPAREQVEAHSERASPSPSPPPLDAAPATPRAPSNAGELKRSEF